VYKLLQIKTNYIWMVVKKIPPAPLQERGQTGFWNMVPQGF